MKKILGIDVGTNSVGWAITQDESILDVGVRIFNEGVNKDKYDKSHVEESKNVKRREARGARRRLFRYKLRRELLKQKLDDLHMLPSKLDETPPQLYKLRKEALNDKIDLKKIGRILLLLNKHRGFKSNRKSEIGEDEKSKSEYYKKLDEMNSSIENSGCRTVGEYFFTLFEQGNKYNSNPFEPSERIRDRFVYRQNYIDEFNLIWDKQAEFYPEILTEENKLIIRDEIIFYTRPLKSQKHLISKCRFEPLKRVAPKSSPIFQEFRVWETINRIRIDDSKDIHRSLTSNEKLKLANYLKTNSNVSLSKIKKLLGIERSAKFNDMPDKLKGNTTYSGIIKALGDEKFNKLEDDEILLIWEKLHYATTGEWLITNLINKHNFTTEEAKAFSKISLEADYCNMSTKAMCKILVHLKNGFGYDKACEEAGYRHSDYLLEDEERPELTEKINVTNNDPVLSNIMSPLVKRSVTECIKVINGVIKKYGKPDLVKIEMGRELNMPKDIRENRHKKNKLKRALRDEYEIFLKEKFGFNKVSKTDLLKFELWLELEHSGADLAKLNPGLSASDFTRFAKNVKSTDKEKFRLWLECGRISVYTRKVIPLHKLFSGEYEVEHIIPYSVSFDDSFANKTLCEREFNRAKGKLTPIQYLVENKDELFKFKRRASLFGGKKKELLLTEELPDDFRPDQLNNNAFTATYLKIKCLEAIPKVEVTNGAVTSKLRRYWGLNTIIKPEENKKSRDDHRHHAIDAVVIAFTKVHHLQQLSTMSAQRVNPDRYRFLFKPPYEGFRQEVLENVSTIIVSHRKDKKLLSAKNNKYIHRRSQNKEPQRKVYSVRGPLHEETTYGKILDPYTGKEEYVVKKKLSELDEKKIDRIVDKAIIKLIRQKAASSGKSIKEILNDDLIQYNEEGKGVKINSVRWKAIHRPDTISVADKHGNLIERNVMLKNNYCANLYINNKGKKVMNIISFYEAVKRKLHNEPMIDQIPDLEYLFTITQDDYLLILDESLDFIPDDPIYVFKNLYKIRKFTGSEIGILHHSDSEIKNIWRMSCGKQKYVKVVVDILGKIRISK